MQKLVKSLQSLTADVNLLTQHNTVPRIPSLAQYYVEVQTQTEPTRWTCKSRQINEERRWQAGTPDSVSFQIIKVSLLLLGLDSDVDQYAGHRSEEG